MKRVNEKVKDIVEIRPFKHLNDFAADPSQTLEGYHFTDITADLMAKWIDRIVGVADGKGVALALAGNRGVGKSHFLAVVNAILSQPDLRPKIADGHVATSSGRLSKQAPIIASVRRGSEPNLIDELKRAIAAALLVEASSLSDLPVEMLKHAVAQAGDRAFVLFIDTALGRDSRVARDDGPVLSEIATAAAGMKMFVGLALDDDISGADGPNAAISRSYTIDYLEQEHLYKIVNTYVFTKHSHMLPVLREIYESYREVLPGFRWSEQRFTALYPLHPACVEIAPLIRLFIHDFALLKFASEAGVKIMGRPANSLIGLDEVFDGVESRLRVVPELADVFAAFDRLESEVIAKSPVQIRLPAKLLLKGLLMLSLDGQGASSKELAASMMIYDGAGAIDVTALLDSFAAALPGPIQKDVASSGEVVYRFDVRSTAADSKLDNEVGELIGKFFGGSDVNGADTQKLAEQFAGPLDLADLDDDGYIPANADALRELDVAKSVLPSDSMSGDVVALDAILSRLESEHGLSIPGQRLVLAAFVSQRLLEFVTSDGNRINHRSLDLKVIWEDIVGVARPLDEQFSAERLLVWARLVTGNSGIKSLKTTEDRLLVIDSLTGWLASWHDERVLDQFDALPDDSLNAAIWRTAASVRKSFGKMATSIDQMSATDAGLDKTLQEIAEGFSDSEEEFTKKSGEMRALRDHMSASMIREKALFYVTRAEPTDDSEIEANRTRLIESIVARTSSMAEDLKTLAATYSAKYTAEHAEVMIARTTAARLAEVVSLPKFLSYQDIAATPLVSRSTGARIDGIIREVRFLRCDGNADLEENPRCACGFRLRDYRRISALPVELGRSVDNAVELARNSIEMALESSEISASDREILRSVSSKLETGERLAASETRILQQMFFADSLTDNTVDRLAGNLGEIFAGDGDDWEREVDRLEAFTGAEVLVETK